MNATDKLAVARARACKLAPYFRSGILALVPRETPGLGTLAVTETGIMLWCPAFVESTPADPLAAVVIHEFLHILYKHAARWKALNAAQRISRRLAEKDPSFDSELHKMWNVAADAAINDSIGALPLPPDVVTPASINLPSGLTAEAYFRALVKRQEEEKAKQSQQSENNNNQNNASQQKQGNSPGQPGQGASQSQSQGNNSGDTSNEPSQGESNKGGDGQSQENNNIQKKHKCGGCAGNPHDIEKDINEKEAGRTQAEMSRVIRQTAQAIKEHAQLKGAGSLPGGLQVWAEETLAPPKINWRVKLNTLVRDAVQHKAGAVTHRYCKPSRRQAGLGYGSGRATLPALIAPTPRVCIALDASGSMLWGGRMDKALAEIQGVLKAINAPVDFVSFDTKLGKLAPVKNMADVRKLAVGAGGTDFRPVFAQLDKQRQCPDILIVLTDGDGRAPSVPPSYKVIWALVKGVAPVAWGTTLNID